MPIFLLQCRRYLPAAAQGQISAIILQADNRAVRIRSCIAWAISFDVGLTGEAETVVTQLPYGQKRALEIATTLALEPEMMLLDEPTAGMAHGDVDRIVDLIRRIRGGRTILMVEHNLSVVEGLCDTITVLTRGRVLAEGDYAEVSKNPEVVAAYLGSEHVHA